MAEDYKILLLGLNWTGKTAILYRGKLGETLSHAIHTINFNVENIQRRNKRLLIWDVSVGKNQLWKYYADALIYVIDASDLEDLVRLKKDWIICYF